MNKKKVRGIRRDVLERILEFAKKSHPREVGGILFVKPELGSDGVINDVREINLGPKSAPQVKIRYPLLNSTLVFGKYSDSVRKSLSYVGVGTVHSHPGYDSRPSIKDLELFSSFGDTNIIIFYPYTLRSWCAYDRNGYPIELKMVEKTKLYEKITDTSESTALVKKIDDWRNTPVKFSDITCTTIKREYSTERIRKGRHIKSLKGRWCYPDEIAGEYYESSGLSVIYPSHFDYIHAVLGVNKTQKTDEHGFSKRLDVIYVNYLDPKYPNYYGYTYLPLSELEKKLSYIKSSNLLSEYEERSKIYQENMEKPGITAGVNAIIIFKQDEQDLLKYHQKYRQLRKETSKFVSEFLLTHPERINQFIRLLRYISLQNSLMFGHRLPIFAYKEDMGECKFCKCYTHSVASTRKQLLKEDRIFYHWNQEYAHFDYEVLMIKKLY